MMGPYSMHDPWANSTGSTGVPPMSTFGTLFECPVLATEWVQPTMSAARIMTPTTKRAMPARGARTSSARLGAGLLSSPAPRSSKACRLIPPKRPGHLGSPTGFWRARRLARRSLRRDCVTTAPSLPHRKRAGRPLHRIRHTRRARAERARVSTSAYGGERHRARRHGPGPRAPVLCTNAPTGIRRQSAVS